MDEIKEAEGEEISSHHLLSSMRKDRPQTSVFPAAMRIDDAVVLYNQMSSDEVSEQELQEKIYQAIGDEWKNYRNEMTGNVYEEGPIVVAAALNLLQEDEIRRLLLLRPLNERYKRHPKRNVAEILKVQYAPGVGKRADRFRESFPPVAQGTNDAALILQDKRPNLAWYPDELHPLPFERGKGSQENFKIYLGVIEDVLSDLGQTQASALDSESPLVEKGVFRVQTNVEAARDKIRAIVLGSALFCLADGREKEAQETLGVLPKNDPIVLSISSRKSAVPFKTS